VKARNGLLIPLLAVFVGVGMIVSAGVIVSNVLQYQNQVSGVSLTSTWTDGSKTIGTQYSFTVTYSSPAGTPNAVIVLEFNVAGILPADVTVAYDVGGGVYLPVTFVQAGPDAIRASTGTVAGGTGGGFFYHLTYNDLATYTMKVWAETP